MDSVILLSVLPFFDGLNLLKEIGLTVIFVLFVFERLTPVLWGGFRLTTSLESTVLGRISKLQKFDMSIKANTVNQKVFPFLFVLLRLGYSAWGYRIAGVWGRFWGGGATRLGPWASWSRDYSMFIQFIQWSLVVSFGLFLVVPRLGGCGWAWVWAIILCDSGTFLVFLDFLRSWVFFSSAGKVRWQVRTMFISSKRTSLYLWWNENLVKHQKLSIYYENDCS